MGRVLDGVQSVGSVFSVNVRVEFSLVRFARRSSSSRREILVVGWNNTRVLVIVLYVHYIGIRSYYRRYYAYTYYNYTIVLVLVLVLLFGRVGRVAL